MTDTSSSDETTPVQLNDDAVQSHLDDGATDDGATDDVLNDAVSGSESTSAPSPDQV